MGPNLTDRGKSDCKRYLIVDGRGVPLALTVTGANRHDSMVFEALLDALSSVRGLSGRSRWYSDKLHTGNGYDYSRCREYLRKHEIVDSIARRGVESKERLGRHRWVVEWTHA